MITMWLVILASYILNAVADAIDHGKGSERLGFLWHSIKAISYGIPFAYILWLKILNHNVLILTGAIMLVILYLVWESVYRFCRWLDISRWDK